MTTNKSLHNHKCPFNNCFKTYKQKSSLIRHLTHEHGCGEYFKQKNKFTCLICNKQFNKIHSYNSHKCVLIYNKIKELVKNNKIDISQELKPQNNKNNNIKCPWINI
jgi:hypothetical protein